MHLHDRIAHVCVICHVHGRVPGFLGELHAAAVYSLLSLSFHGYYDIPSFNIYNRKLQGPLQIYLPAEGETITARVGGTFKHVRGRVNEDGLSVAHRIFPRLPNDYAMTEQVKF